MPAFTTFGQTDWRDYNGVGCGLALLHQKLEKIFNMDQKDHWLLPEGIDELLPREAERLEVTRRELLDLYSSWGYELVVPPFVEFVDSLLIGTGSDLKLRTFKLNDQISGRTMGVRADMTPQVARIDAHCLNRNAPTRLCYLGTILQTLPDCHGGTRSPLQLGAELYGHQGIESDREVLTLMIETLKRIGFQTIYLDLGHVAVFRSLAKKSGLNKEQEKTLFDALQRKSVPDIEVLLGEWGLSAENNELLSALVDLNGDVSVLDSATTLFKESGSEVNDALDQLKTLASDIAEIDGVNIHIDLAELRGYHYHTGLVFAAYVPGLSTAMAIGGRYDSIGKVFGRARPATGFSLDLKTVLAQVPMQKAGQTTCIFAPDGKSSSLKAEIAALRQQGIRVIQSLPGQQATAQEMGCNQQLVDEDGKWVIKDL